MNKSMCLLVPVYLLSAPDLYAQDDELVEEIIVTGSRIVRTDLYGESGQVVEMDEVYIDSLAELNIADVLRGSPLNSHGSVHEESARSNQSDAYVNIRGLGPERTLVLVDGMRVPGSPNYTAAAANINMLPMAAVKRVDILADGASAVYGSDAMAGVVNLVLHRDFEGIEVSMRYGDRSRDDGGDRSFSILGGINGDKGNVIIAMEYSHRDPIFDRDRWYTAPKIEDDDGDGEIHWILDTVGIAYSGRTWEIFDPVTGYIEWRAAADCPETDGFVGVMGLGFFGAWDETVCAYASGEIAANRAELEKLNGYMYASYDLSDRAELYTRALIAKNESFGRWAPAPGGWEPPADHPHNPFDMEQMIADGLITDQAELWGHYRWTSIGPRDGNFTDVQWDFSTGVKGDLSDRASFDFHAQVGRYDSTEIFRHELNYIGLDYVQRNNIDPFSELGTAAMAAQLTQNNFTEQSRIYGHAQIDAWDVFGAGESIALIGAEYVEFEWENLSEGGFAAGHENGSNLAQRDIKTLFMEYMLPLSNGTELNLAGRYDDYSDFGGTFTPSIGIVSHLTDRFSIRVRWGEGFVAPDFDSLYGPGYETGALLYDPVMDTWWPIESIYYYSNPDLQPETSTSMSAGINWEYLEGHSVDLTYYEIDIRDVIDWPHEQSLLWADAAGTEWDPNGVRVVRVGDFIREIHSYATNVNRNEVSGLDLQLRSTFDTRFGRFDLGALYSRQLSFKQNAIYGGGYQETRGLHNQPDTRVQASVRWGLGDHSVDFVVSYIGPHAAWDDQDPATGEITASEEEYDSWTTANLTYSFDAGDWGRIKIGANNVTDEDPVLSPDRVDPATSNLYDKTGRVIFAEYRKTFD